MFGGAVLQINMERESERERVVEERKTERETKRRARERGTLTIKQVLFWADMFGGPM